MPRRHPIHLVNSRLAGRYGTRQVELLGHADAVTEAVDVLIGRAWRKLLAALRKDETGGNYSNSHSIPPQALATLEELPGLLRQQLGSYLTQLAGWAHETAADALTATVPVAYLRAAAGVPLTEARQLREDLPADQPPGAIELGYGSDRDFEFADLLAPLRSGELPDSEARTLFGALLFPAPPADRVARIVYGDSVSGSWQDRLAKVTRLASPELLAPLIANSFAAGESHRDLAKALLPVIGGIKSDARRIARTEAMRVAHAVQAQAQAPLDDLTIGYQVHATLDQNTRPEHRHRNGTIYYREPAGGQLGLDRMPHPPLEADGSVAWNCRCWTSPVLSPPGHILASPQAMETFHRGAALAVPDPAVFADWFAGAPERLQRLAVGSRRYSAVRDKLGATPGYHHFVSPDTGHLLSTEVLKTEPARSRQRRVRLLGRLARRRQEDLARVATYGFLPPAPRAAVGAARLTPPH